MSHRNITTKKLKEILDDPYTRGVDGADFESKYSREALQDEYYDRINKEYEKQLKERERQERSAQKTIKRPVKKVEWRMDEYNGQEVAILEIDDIPFYSARVLSDEDFFTTIINDGHSDIMAESFKNIEDAFNYGRSWFKKLTKANNVYNQDYQVKVMNPKRKI